LLMLSDDDRREWLRSYQRLFLERDLADLARLSDLHPFQTLQRLCMLRSGQLLSYAELGRDAGVGATTAKRYLEYLRISYQVVLLQPYRRNVTSSLVKSPKLYWVDMGLLRHGSRHWGELTGAQFETFVASEVHKWISTMSRDVELTFYRTRSGMEVDLIIQTAHGVLGIEIKNRGRAHRSDTRSLRALATAFGDEWLGGLVVHRGSGLTRLDAQASVWAMPIHRLV